MDIKAQHQIEGIARDAGIQLSFAEPLRVEDVARFTLREQNKVFAKFMIAVSTIIIENEIDLDVIRGGAWDGMIATQLEASGIRRQDADAVLRWGFQKIKRILL